MKFTTHFTLGKKLFVAPAILVLFMLASGVSALWGLNTQNSVIDGMYNGRFAAYRACVTIGDDMQKVQTNLYKLLGWANAKYEMAKIEAMGKEQTATLGKTSESLKKLIASPSTSAAEKKLYQETLTYQTEYAKSATDMIDMLGADLNAATMFMGTADEKFQVLNKSLDDLQAYQNKMSDESFKSSAVTYRKVLGIFATVLLVAIIISVMVTLAMNRSILAPVRRTIEIIEEVAAGDLTKRINARSHDEIGELAEHFDGFAERLHNTVSHISQSAREVAAASKQLLINAEQIATGAEEVASQAGTVATASEEMAATSSDIAENCTGAAHASEEANSTALAGSAVVQETINGMLRITERVQATARTVEALGSRSDQIGAIIGTIEDIADQTNLLALNAAIEAARAGEMGRGFAVVADEVRALAERTTKATREIGDMIKAVQAETRGAVESMEEGVHEVERGSAEAAKSGAALQDILNKINEVTMQVNQIATAAEEQTATTSEITNNIQQITDVVRQTADGASGSSAAANQLAGLASDLQKQVSQFKLAV